ncbi:hypothetical protein ABMA28_014409 [Loxostege sticticalis]|uniref:Zinc finger CW-type PWWP domain protein 1 n=1 Tax=Loxostege sticticalis TaxID=481309 RepID=A0ABD0TGP9_LOXSC
MDLQGDLPSAKTAKEPEEGAQQPLSQIVMSPPSENRPTGTQVSEISSSSQCKSSYKDALSQPAPGMTQRQRLLWLQKRHKTGLWVQCDDCDRWRYLPHILDSKELPNKWYCKMNPDRSAADCSVPEKPIRPRDEEDLIHSEYSAGSVVLARLPGWPWWPAMVEDCPDTEQYYWLDGFSDIPTYYNVVFFDSYEATRAWIAPQNLKPYNANKRAMKHAVKDKRYKNRLEVAYKQADDADMLPLSERLAKYSFLNRYKGTIGEPKELTREELLKFKNKLKRKLNIDFSDDSDSDENHQSDRDNVSPKIRKQSMKNKNVILIGTPKRRKVNKDLPDQANDEVVDTNTSIIIQSSPTPNIESEQNEEQVEAIFKQPNSLTVQIGSTVVNETMNLDDDSSKTYLPESKLDTNQSTDLSQSQTEIHVRIASPSSDDFEF